MRTKEAVSMARLRQSRRDAGIVKVEVWVSRENAAIVRKMALELNGKKLVTTHQQSEGQGV
jgi:hypothetical protein